MGLNLNLQGIHGEIVRQHSWFLSLSWLDLCANLQRGETDSIQTRIWLWNFFRRGCFCLPDLGVKHEGYVERHWLDYDETLRNDAFLQDIFTAARDDAPITLTQGGVFGDPSGKKLSSPGTSGWILVSRVKLTHCIVFPETPWRGGGSVIFDFIFYLLFDFVFWILFNMNSSWIYELNDLLKCFNFQHPCIDSDSDWETGARNGGSGPISVLTSPYKLQKMCLYYVVSGVRRLN